MDAFYIVRIAMVVYMKKVFVDVLVKCTTNGQKLPIAVTWEDGRKYTVDKISDIRQAASLKVGGQGVRYKCRICGKDTFLWLEDGKWFMEGK